MATLVDPAGWDRFLTAYPDAHLLQTSAWGELKAGFGWRAERIAVGETGAQVLFRRLPLGLSLAYIPKGPLGPDWRSLWPLVDDLCKARRAILLKVEPDLWEESSGSLGVHLPGFQPDGIPVQPRRTLVVSLEGDEAAWLARMKPKTRYNIRLAERKGVAVKPSSDVESFHRMMQITGSRDGFGVHSLEYYRCAYQLFQPSGAVQLFLADYQGSPLAGLMAFKAGRRAWYFYGASGEEERNRMPAYLLQWEAMRWAASQGCSEYDLWGVPDEEEDTLEAQFETRSDGLWGVYRFKRGFGGALKRGAATWERVYIPPLYRLYRWWARRAGD
jgi:lipid II:glycine glycyltransferase (peptidoglycan interpeptide bridge formation enzyme)